MRALLAGMVVALGLAACSSGGGGVPAHGCAAVHHDPIDPRSILHLLPGAPEPPYATDPPTSGAHRVGYYPRGVVAQPIARPVQVALLEVGFVIVQYRPAPGVAAVLAPLTAQSPYVTVAPNPTLLDPVVATAWVENVRCGDAGAGSVRSLKRFIAARLGHGPSPTIPLSSTAPGGVRP